MNDDVIDGLIEYTEEMVHRIFGKHKDGKYFCSKCQNKCHQLYDVRVERDVLGYCRMCWIETL